MKNYIKIIFAVILIFFIGVVIFSFVTGEKDDGTSYDGEKIVTLNDIVKNVEENWNQFNTLGAESLFTTDYGVDFCILDESNEVLYDSREKNRLAEDKKLSGVDETLSVETAVKKRYPYKFIIVENRVAGSVILIDDGMSGIRSARIKLIIGIGICGLVLLIAMILFYIYVNRNIIGPFRRMEEFAGRVAEGRLDEPIAIDRNNIFGAFSESFDIMREELAKSKKRELALQKKERELVASLSHDLKTPITGIKLTSELLQAKLSMMDKSSENGISEESAADISGKTGQRTGCTPKEMSVNRNVTARDVQDIIEKLGNIYKKADQIDILVSDLFASTLDDLGEFRVSLQDETSNVIDDIIRKYDDKALVKQEQIPEVIINTDVRRLSQVIGNIIANSYKYAGTNIDVSYRITDGYLKMSIRDYGPGVPESEIDLITNKFYRGKDWKDSKQEGSGLGLYIAKTLMEKMNGELVAESDGKGLEITLLIPLS